MGLAIILIDHHDLLISHFSMALRGAAQDFPGHLLSPDPPEAAKWVP